MIMRFSKQARASDNQKTSSSAASRALFLFVAVIVFFFSVAVVQARMVSISGGKVNMRKGPGKKYSILWELGKGFPLVVLGKKGNWLKVRDFEGDVGWVYRKLTSKTPHFIVKVKRANIRSGAGKQSRIVGRANHGVVFRSLGIKNGWVKVRHESGLTGWIWRKLLWGW